MNGTRRLMDRRSMLLGAVAAGATMAAAPTMAQAAFLGSGPFAPWHKAVVGS